MQKNMTPNQIKYALKLKDVTQTSLANYYGCSVTTVFRAIKDPTTSFPVASLVAKTLGKSMNEVWPEIYGPNPVPPKTGRPFSPRLQDRLRLTEA